jgi:hypothetical protein
MMKEQKQPQSGGGNTHTQAKNKHQGQYSVPFKDGNNDILKTVPPLYKLNTHCPKF